jgi:hypothetical protein
MSDAADSHLVRLLEEFASVLPGLDEAATAVARPFDDLDQYWLVLELKFSLRSMVVTGESKCTIIFILRPRLVYQYIDSTHIVKVWWLLEETRARRSYYCNLLRISSGATVIAPVLNVQAGTVQSPLTGKGSHLPTPAAHRNFETTLMLGHSRGLLNTTTAAEAGARLDELTALSAAVDAYELGRIAATAGDSEVGLPIDVRLGEAYSLPKHGLELFQLLTLRQTASSKLFRCALGLFIDRSDSAPVAKKC